MAIQSDTAALLSPSSAEVAAQGWEKPPSVYVWSAGRGVRKGLVFLHGDQCQLICGMAGKFGLVETTSLNLH